MSGENECPSCGASHEDCNCRSELDRLAARLAEAEATLREMREALERIRDAGHENGNYCDVELADGRDCDCTRAIAEAALSRVRERLGAK